MGTFNTDKHSLLDEAQTVSRADGRWKPSGGEETRACRMVTGEGGYFEFDNDNTKTVHLYWPPTTQDRDAKFVRLSWRDTAYNSSNVSDIFSTASTFLPSEPPKSDPWMVSHEFTSEVLGIDVTGPCAIMATAEPLVMIA